MEAERKQPVRSWWLHRQQRQPPKRQQQLQQQEVRQKNYNTDIGNNESFSKYRKWNTNRFGNDKDTFFRKHFRYRYGSTASKSATGTTAKKKDTAAEATTGSWNFSGEDYVPDTYAADETDAAEADTTAEKDNDTSKIVAVLGIFYIVKRICAIAVVVIIAFILYKKRHRIASALRNFQKGGDKE